MIYTWTKDKQNAASPPKRYLEIREAYAWITYQAMVRKRVTRPKTVIK